MSDEPVIIADVPHGSLFEGELRGLLNAYSLENQSNTPDFILASFMLNCLNAFDRAVVDRSNWYGRHDEPGQPR